MKVADVHLQNLFGNDVSSVLQGCTFRVHRLFKAHSPSAPQNIFWGMTCALVGAQVIPGIKITDVFKFHKTMLER